MSTMRLVVASVGVGSVTLAVWTVVTAQIITSQPRASSRQGRPAPPSEQASKALEAEQRTRFLQTHTLHEIAIADGGYYGFDDNPNPDTIPARGLEDLGAAAQLAIVGTPTSSMTELNEELRWINTYYEVRVDDTIKADRSAPASLMVRTPGGRVTFADGAVVEMRTGFRLEVGKQYLLLIRQNETDAMSQREKELAAFYITGGPQGAYELGPSGIVRPLAHSAHPVTKRYAGKPVREFLDEARVKVFELPPSLPRGVRR